MTFHRKVLYAAGVALAALSYASFGHAQSWGPRTLDELKQETQRRADRNAPPVGGVKPEDVRAALAQVDNLQPDTWANAYIRVGDQYLARAKTAEATAPAEARELYHRAWETYNLGRWPTENSPAKKQAYAKALEAFAAYGKLMDPPIEVVRIPYEGKGIVGYLRVPKARPAPLVFGISGLDSRKEDVAAGSDSYISNGIAVFAVDMPGTGQAPVKVDVGAEHMFSRALDQLLARPEIDGKRVIVQGRSWSGYWAATMGYTERNRLRGVVVQGGPVHAYFTAEWQKKALTTPEYLFDLFPARSAIYDVATMEDFLAYGPRMSLVARGMIDKPSAPMLLVNGERDTQVPIEDLYLLMKHGDPKEAWVNPAGGHMGRSQGWSSRDISQRVVMPWILRRLGMPPAVARN